MTMTLPSQKLETATLWSLDEGSIGSCALGTDGTLLINANDPSRQSDVENYINGRYRVYAKRMRALGASSSPAAFMEGIHRWASTTFMSVSRPSRFSAEWHAKEYLSFDPKRITKNPRRTAQVSQG